MVDLVEGGFGSGRKEAGRVESANDEAQRSRRTRMTIAANPNVNVVLLWWGKLMPRNDKKTRPSRPIRCDVWIIERMRYQPTDRQTNEHSLL